MSVLIIAMFQVVLVVSKHYLVGPKTSLRMVWVGFSSFKIYFPGPGVLGVPGLPTMGPGLSKGVQDGSPEVPKLDFPPFNVPCLPF